MESNQSHLKGRGSGDRRSIDLPPVASPTDWSECSPSSRSARNCYCCLFVFRPHGFVLSSPWPLRWKHGVSTTEPPGKSPETVLFDQQRCLSCHHFKIWLFLPNIWVSNFSWIIWRSINLVPAHLHSRWACGINISLPYWRHSTHILCSAPWNVNSSLTCKS